MPLIYELPRIPSWTAAELAELPKAEDESHEYKSSRISMSELRKDIGLAGSGFWNAGGGVLIVGVDGTGRPDGGIEVSVGRQPLRDWVDQCLGGISPRGDYRIAVIQDAAPGIHRGRAVMAIAFAASHLAPHMAPDNRYYIRAGAHTVPAPHFLVEALMAQRGLTQPLLRPMLRQKTGVGYVLELGLVAATSAPALDVQIELPSPPPYLARKRERVSLSVGVITPATPFFFDFHVLTMGSDVLPPFPVKVEYQDAAGRQFAAEFNIDISSQLGLTLVGDPGNRDVIKKLDELVNSVKALGGSIKNNEQHLRTIAAKFR